MVCSVRPWVCLVVFYAALPVAPCLAASISTIVDDVSETSYTYYLQDMLYTETGDNRGYGAEHDLARTAIYNAFSSFGLTTSLEYFSHGGYTGYNVVGVWGGTRRPNDIFVVGAHYDSVSNPGADDNASGVAGVLESARVLSQYDFEATLVFIAFDREEQGLHGSRGYAAAHSLDQILGMVDLDMIAYNPATSSHDRVALYKGTGSLPGDAALKTELAYAINTYGQGLQAVDRGAIGASDHQSFQEVGKPACLLIEDSFSSNPYYHTAQDSTDTLNYIDYNYATRVTRGVVGYMAENAVTPEPASLALFVAGLFVLALVRVGRRGAQKT
ncbi:MAG: M28 family peptidase [Armatimonadia bacterium]